RPPPSPLFPYPTLFRSCPRGVRPAPSLRPSPALGIILLILQAVRLAVELRQLFGRDQRLGVIQLVVLGQEEGIGFLLGLVGLLRSEEHTSELQSRENLV